jgi:hypothetical protein
MDSAYERLFSKVYTEFATQLHTTKDGKVVLTGDGYSPTFVSIIEEINDREGKMCKLKFYGMENGKSVYHIVIKEK